MLTTKKLIALLMAIMMLLPCLFSCGNDPVETEPEQTEAPKETESETETETEPEVLVPELEDIIIKVEDLEKYRLIVPDEAGVDVKFEVRFLYYALRDKFAPKMEYRTDLVVPGYPLYSESEYEIILSVCERDASVEAASELGYYDYTYKAVGTKLLICAVSIDALKMAIEDFTANVIDVASADKDAVFFNNKEQAKIVRADYKTPNLMLDGVSIDKYTIIYPSASQNNEKYTAETLRDMIAKHTGCYLEVYSDKEKKEASGYEIHIGTTNRDEAFASTLTLNEGEAYIGKNGESFVVFSGANALDLYLGMFSFVSWMDSKTGESGLDYKSAEIGKMNIEKNDSISIMCYNVQMWAPTIGGKPEATMQVIINKNPDIFGVQEATPAWMVILRDTFGEQYGCVGIGRNGIDNATPENSGDVENQYCAIFYKKEKFNLIEEGTKWLSLTPDEVSKVDGSYATRAFTYALLERKSDGKRFVFVNTHLDHVSGQEDQMCILANYINEHFSEYPVLITGDFNTQSGADRYKVMLNAGYADGKKGAAVKINSNIGTNPNSNEIDFCFGSADHVYFEKYEVISDKTFNDETPSDHYALYLEFGFFD